MNLFLNYQKKIIKLLNKLKKKRQINLPKNLAGITVELPPKNQEADMSSNVALLLSKVNNKSPVECAVILKKHLLINFKEFSTVDIAKPGFLNIRFKNDFWMKYLFSIIKNGKKYGSNKILKKKYNIEFVSANPTGPLHVGHCRGAVLGDALSNLLKFNGHNVTKEYYVNDYGNQVDNFAMSIYYRILEILKNKSFPDDENLYPGDYIIDIAKKIIKDKNIKNYNDYESIKEKLVKKSLNCSIEEIKKNLIKLGIKHDNFIYESKLINNKLVTKTVKKLEKDNYIYKGKIRAPKGNVDDKWEEREQLLFRSTIFGDDIDRPLQKSDKTWTYFAGDIAYHANKIERKFDVLINILGADHAGYTKRISAAVSAISKKKTNLICKVSQLVKLLKKGEPFKMSKRKGNYITIDDLLNEVGKDSVRFMMLSRSNDAELDFDFEKVTEKSKDNPVFYVQYAYARINSIFRAINLDLSNKIKLDKKNYILNKHETEILKKISEWPKCVEISSNKLEPHRISFYLYDLVTLFHSYWNLGSSNKEYRFVINNKMVNSSRMLLLKALSLVIENGMNILGVSTPKSM